MLELVNKALERLLKGGGIKSYKVTPNYTTTQWETTISIQIEVNNEIVYVDTEVCRASPDNNFEGDNFDEKIQAIENRLVNYLLASGFVELIRMHTMYKEIKAKTENGK